MKAFLASVLVAGVAAFGASLVMDRFDVSADQRFVGANSRVDAAGTPQARNFAGQPPRQ